MVGYDRDKYILYIYDVGHDVVSLLDPFTLLIEY